METSPDVCAFSPEDMPTVTFVFFCGSYVAVISIYVIHLTYTLHIGAISRKQARWLSKINHHLHNKAPSIGIFHETYCKQYEL